jgi:hypothetical protein
MKTKAHSGHCKCIEYVKGHFKKVLNHPAGTWPKELFCGNNVWALADNEPHEFNNCKLSEVPNRIYFFILEK